MVGCVNATDGAISAMPKTILIIFVDKRLATPQMRSVAFLGVRLTIASVTSCLKTYRGASAHVLISGAAPEAARYRSSQLTG